MKKFNLAFYFFIIFAVSIPAQNISDDLAKGIELFKNKDFTQAYEKLKNVVSNADLNKNSLATANFYIAECMINLNQVEGATSEYEKFVEKFKFSNFRDLALYRLGTIYFSKKDFSKAREKFLVLLNEYPSSDYVASSNYFTGESYVSEKRFLEAEDFYKTAISQQRSNPYIDQTIFALANLYEKISKFSLAVTYYDELLTYYRDSRLAPEAQLRIGICYFELKNYDNAILELTEAAIKQLPAGKQIEAQYYIANANYRLKDYSNAKQVYKKILDVNPDESLKRQVLYGLAWTNFQSEDFKEAFNLFDGLAKSATDTIAVSSLFWSGEAKRYSGDQKAARTIIDDFISKYPEHYLIPRAKFSVGSLEYTKGENVTAELNLKAVLNTNDEVSKTKAYTLLGEISLNKKDFNTARNYFNNALSNEKMEQDLRQRALLGLGITDFYLNQYDAAIKNLTSLNSASEKFEKNKVSFYLAESYFAKGEFSKALRFYNAIVITNDDLGKQALYGKAYSYLNLRDFANASYYFKDYTARFPKSEEYLDARLRLADSYFGMKDFDKAGAIYNDIFSKQKIDVNDDASYYQYVRALYMSNQKNKALDELENFKKKFPSSRFFDNVQYLTGWIHFQKNDFQNAIADYKKIYTKNPSSSLKPIAFTSIGDCYYNLAEYDSALVFYRKIFTSFPNSQYVFDAIRGIQDCYMIKDQPETAIAEIDKFIGANPKSKYADQIFFKKGEVYYGIGNYQQALVCYSDFIKWYPSSSLIPHAYYWIGKSYVNSGSPGGAKGNFKTVVDGYITSEVGIDAALELGKILTSEEDYNGAEAVYNKTISALPDSRRIPEVLFMKASLYQTTNNLSKAYETYNQIINYHDNSVFASKAKIDLGMLELAGGRPESAEQYFRSQADSKVDDLAAKAQYYLGVALFDQNKIEDAITALVRIRSVFGMYDEWLTKSLLKLGDCYVKTKDKQKAKEMYQAVLIRHKNDTYSNEANNKLNKL